MPTQWQNLKTQINLPPYNGQTDAVNMAQLNALSVAQDVNGNVLYGTLEPARVREALGFTATEDWGWIVQVAEGQVTSANNSGAGAQTVTPVTQRACWHFREFFGPGTAAIPMNANRVTQFTQGLTYLSGSGVNVISAAGVSAVTALMSWPQLWPYANGFARLLDLTDFPAARAS